MMFKRVAYTLFLLAIVPLLANAGLEVLLEPIHPSSSKLRTSTDSSRVPVPRVLTVPKGKPDNRATTTGTHTVTIEKLLPSLVENIKETLHVEGDLRLTPRDRWTPFYHKGKEWRVEMIGAIPTNLGPLSVVQFKVFSDDKLLGVWKQSFRCQLFQDVLVSNKPMENGRFVDPLDFSTRSLDVLQMRQRPVVAGEGLKRHQLRQTLRPGTILLWRHVSAIPLVRKGDIVDVVASEGGLIITLKGQARENGADGDLILVRNPNSKRDFQAQVFDDKKVRVNF